MRTSLLGILLFGAIGSAFAQGVFSNGVTDLKGQFTVRGGGYSQVIELRGIQANSDGRFKAKLSIWTAKTSCTVNAVPVEGTVTADEFSIEGKNPNCWDYKIVGRPAKERKFVGTMDTDGRISDFYLD